MLLKIKRQGLRYEHLCRVEDIELNWTAIPDMRIAKHFDRWGPFKSSYFPRDFVTRVRRAGYISIVNLSGGIDTVHGQTATTSLHLIPPSVFPSSPLLTYFSVRLNLPLHQSLLNQDVSIKRQFTRSTALLLDVGNKRFLRCLFDHSMRNSSPHTHSTIYSHKSEFKV